MKSKQQIPSLVSFLSTIIISALLNNNNGVSFTSVAAAVASDDQQSTSTAHHHSLRIGNNIMDTSTTVIITDEEEPTKELVDYNKQQPMRSLEIVRDDTSEDEMPVIVGWRRRTQGKLYCIEGLLL